MLKEMPVEDSAAEYSLTGIDTMPKETVAVAIARGAAIMSSSSEERACIYPRGENWTRGQVRPLPRQARGGPNSRAFRGRRHGAAGAVRRPETRRAKPSFRLPPGARRGARVVGGPEGAVLGSGRQAPRRARRGPPARVRRLRGADPQGQLRRGRGHRVGQGRVDGA